LNLPWLNLFAPLLRLSDRLRHARLGDTGRRGEDLAHRWLRGKGYLIVARNWRPATGPGEIDIIAWAPLRAGGATLVFVEVKTRSVNEWSAPEREIDADKIRALQRAVRYWLKNNRPERVRFDVIAITGSSLQHFEDAFPVG
jgi:putative endonuclease